MPPLPIGRPVGPQGPVRATPLLVHVLVGEGAGGLVAGFPWAALGPVVLAARYGVAQGAACAALAAAVLTVIGGPCTATLAIGTLVPGTRAVCSPWCRSWTRATGCTRCW